jgi:proline iminopeptidase
MRIKLGLICVLTAVVVFAETPPVTREGFIDVPGGRVWYRIVGADKSKTALLTLHGGPGMPGYYLSPLSKLSDERPVIFYDQLGCGRSDHPKDPSLWRIGRFVEELASVRKALRLQQVHILAHSWGTMLAMEYMKKLGGRDARATGVQSIILSGPAISVKKWLADANHYRRQLPVETQAILKKHEEAGTTDSKEYQDAVMVYYQKHFCRLKPWPPEMDATMKNIGMDVYMTMWGPSEFYSTGNLKNFDGTPELRRLKAPVLFIAGRYDEASPETTMYYKSLVPGSSVVILGDSSHMAMLEQPEKYVTAVRQFLRNQEDKTLR